MSTDPAHSLSDAFEAEIGGEPTEIRRGLFGLQIDAQQRLEQHWEAIQEYATSFLSWAGADPVAAEEITVLPGFEEVFSLIDIRRFHDEGRWDCIVVDCAPTAETLRLLSLPEISRWYMERVFPLERRVVKVVRPILQRVTSLPTPPERFFEAMERLYASLSSVGAVLTDKATSSVRLVVNPEKMVVAEARRLFTYLSLFGYRVDAVVVNRLIPDAVKDPYFVKWKKIQAQHMDEIRESFAPVPILTARLYDEEMVGPALLAELAAEVYQDREPLDVLHSDEPMRVRKHRDEYTLSLRLPFADGRLELNRRGEELILTVGSYRRSILLPQVLRRLEVRDAAFEGPELRVRFGAKETS
jgi:arsenite-transporting ATPase